MKTLPILRLRDMLEDYLVTQRQAVRVPVEGERHCWMVNEERIETRSVFDWLGKNIGTQSITIASTRYVWIGSKGAVTVTKDAVFHKGGNVESALPLDMKRWVWNEYFGITL